METRVDPLCSCVVEVDGAVTGALGAVASARGVVADARGVPVWSVRMILLVARSANLRNTEPNSSIVNGH